MAEGVVSKWDWTKESYHWAYLVRITYWSEGDNLTSPAEKTVYWCGPRARVMSGVTTTKNPAREQFFPDGLGGATEMVHWEPRLSGGTFNRTFGSIKTHIQPASTVSFSVGMDGTTETELLRDALTGRWANKQCKIWFFDMDTRSAILRFDGKLDRNPDGVTLEGFRMAAIQGLALEAVLPTTRMPALEYAGAYNGYGPYSRIGATVLNSSGYGGQFDSFHPGTTDVTGDTGYHIPEAKRSTNWGCFFGGSGVEAGTTDGSIRELVFYGYQVNPSVAAGTNLFFHVSPQMHCFVEKVWWTMEDGSVLSATTSTASGPYFVNFNNSDDQYGPTGTNIRLSAGNTFWDPFHMVDEGDPVQTLWGRVMAPPRGVETIGSTSILPEYPAIRAMYDGGATLDQAKDSEIIQQIFLDDDMLNLPGSFFQPGALSDLENFAPFGPASGNDWRKFVCAVPKGPVNKPPLVRSVIGDLAQTAQFDIAYRLSSTGSVGMAPVRRRPSPGNMSADWVILEGDPLQVQPASWTHADDPDGVYSNDVLVKSADWYLELDTGDEDDALGLPQGDTAFYWNHRDQVEILEENFGRVRSTSLESNWWVVRPTTLAQEGRIENATFQAEALSQPQRGVEIVLGPRHYEIELGDVIAYDLVGIYDDPGQVRSIQESWDALTLKIKSLHIVFCPSAQGGGDLGRHGSAQSDDAHSQGGIVTPDGGPPRSFSVGKILDED